MVTIHPFCVWFCFQWLFLVTFAKAFRLAQRREWSVGRWFGDEHSIAPIVSQYALSVLHVWFVIVSGSAYAYRDQLVWQEAFTDWGIWFSLTYFVVDSMAILFDLKNQAFFLLHHAVAFLIGFSSILGICRVTEISQYILALEMSNVALTVWDLVKRFRVKNPGVLVPAYRFITPVFAFTYVPMRTLVLPIVTWNLFLSVSTRSSTVLLIFSALLVFILGMSIKFSFKVASIGLRVMKESYPHILSFASLTYVFKAYVSLGWFLIVLPKSSSRIPLGIAFLAADALSIAASLNYSSAGERPSLEATALDYAAVCVKIVVNGFFISAHGFLEGYDSPAETLTWIVANAMQVAILCRTIYALRRTHGSQWIFDSFAERTMPWPYVAHFLLSTAIPIVIMGADCPYVSFALYVMGGVVWTFGGSWGVGGMHVFMTLADVALLSMR